MVSQRRKTMELTLSPKQKEIVTTNASEVVVIAAAASGKTCVLSERVKYLLEKKKAPPTRIVVITYTNAAAEEIAERIGRPEGLFIGTIHSYCNYLLMSQGIDTSKVLNAEQFDKLFEIIMKHPECIREVDYLLLDESQDSNKMQFHFLLNMMKPKNYMLVGDYRQSIYRWNGAYPDFIMDLAQKPEVTTFDLNENYRNGKEILQYAKNIINLAGYDYRDRSKPMCENGSKVIEVNYSPTAIAQTIKKYGNYKDWFVLTRKNSEVDEMCRALRAIGVPFDCFKRSHLDNKELNKKISEDTVKVLTIHTAKGLEAKNVVVIGAKFYNLEEKCISYVAATRARELLVWARDAKIKKAAPRVERWE